MMSMAQKIQINGQAFRNHSLFAWTSLTGVHLSPTDSINGFFDVPSFKMSLVSLRIVNRSE